MSSLQFSILRFGAFDSGTFGPRKDADAERLISAYEFEFYTEDSPGGQYNDGVFYPARRNRCTLAKPGQAQRVVRPSWGYFLNVATQDSELCDLFDHLPNTFVLWNIEEVVKLIRQMIATEEKKTLVGRLQLQSCVCRIISLLSQYSQSPQSVDQGTLQHQETLRMVDKYIREHISEDLSLSKLATLSNLDPTYFQKLYTAAFGKSPTQRLLGYRIAAAKTGLLEGKLSLGELAARCGFSSQTYFCYKFKQVTGMTPLQYRNNILSRK